MLDDGGYIAFKEKADKTKTKKELKKLRQKRLKLKGNRKLRKWPRKL